MISRYAGQLEALYREKNRRCFVDPDPLSVLYRYQDPLDREIAAMISAALAYGNVRQILKSVDGALCKMEPSPREYVEKARNRDFMADFKGFVHRFATGAHLSAMLSGIQAALDRHGSLMACFQAGLTAADITYLPALAAFADSLRSAAPSDPGHLLPVVPKGSACKRLNLFLRWMVRKDDVDPGGWDALCPSRLIVPLDVHMHRVCLELGITSRKQPGMKTALDITAAFSSIVPEDPVRYDFVLTRRGIRREEGFYMFC